MGMTNGYLLFFPWEIGVKLDHGIIWIEMGMIISSGCKLRSLDQQPIHILGRGRHLFQALSLQENNES